MQSARSLELDLACAHYIKLLPGCLTLVLFGAFAVDLIEFALVLLEGDIRPLIVADRSGKLTSLLICLYQE